MNQNVCERSKDEYDITIYGYRNVQYQQTAWSNTAQSVTTGHVSSLLLMLTELTTNVFRVLDVEQPPSTAHASILEIRQRRLNVTDP